MTSTPSPEPPRLFVSTQLYAAAKRLGYREATQELMRQVGDCADLEAEGPGIPAARTIARAVALEPAQLNVNAGATVIGKARSLAAAEFLASGADVWLSVDDDVSACPLAVATAISQARAEPCLVIVPCLLRDTLAGANPAPIVNLVAGDVALVSSAPSGGRVETVEAGGFGCFALSREVVQTVHQLCGDRLDFKHAGRLVRALFRDEIIEREWVTEDLAFCRFVRSASFRCWAVRTGYSVHAGQRLDLRTLDALRPKDAGSGPRSGLLA